MVLTNDFFVNLYVILTENVMATNVWDFIFFFVWLSKWAKATDIVFLTESTIHVRTICQLMETKVCLSLLEWYSRKRMVWNTISKMHSARCGKWKLFGKRLHERNELHFLAWSSNSSGIRLINNDFDWLFENKTLATELFSFLIRIRMILWTHPTSAYVWRYKPLNTGSNVIFRATMVTSSHSVFH